MVEFRSLELLFQLSQQKDLSPGIFVMPKTKGSRCCVIHSQTRRTRLYVKEEIKLMLPSVIRILGLNIHRPLIDEVY